MHHSSYSVEGIPDSRASYKRAAIKEKATNRLEKLKGDLSGFHSIRINDQWRIMSLTRCRLLTIIDRRRRWLRMHSHRSPQAKCSRKNSWSNIVFRKNHLAKAIGISPNRIAEIVNNRRRITADTALRLSLYFGNSPEFWMNLQTHYDLKMARQNLDAKDIKRIKTRRAA